MARGEGEAGPHDPRDWQISLLLHDSCVRAANTQVTGSMLRLGAVLFARPNLHVARKEMELIFLFFLSGVGIERELTS